MTIETFDPQQNIEPSISLSEKALNHIRREIDKAGGGQSFRLYLQTSGCSGFMYETELVLTTKEDEQTFAFDDVNIVIPKKDLPVLNGTEIDFVTVGLNSLFKFNNPNVTGECGCGESFSVTKEG